MARRQLAWGQQGRVLRLLDWILEGDESTDEERALALREDPP